MAIDLNKITPKQKLIIEKGLIDYVYIMKYWKDNDIEYSGVAEPCFPLKEPPNIPVKRANLSANESQ